MAARILLDISARSVTIGLWAKGRLFAVHKHGNDESALAALQQVLAAHGQSAVYLMVDAVEEDFRAEQMPHVVGRARREMVDRRLGQLFRTAPYRAAWLQGRCGDRRRDDQYLFMALNNADWIRPYLELLQSCRAPLAGIYLLPVTSQSLLAQIKPDSPGSLLVSLQSGGLRQTFFHEGRMRMSRLTPLDPAIEVSLGGQVSAEVEKSRAFLYNNRLLARNQLLVAYVVDPSDTLAELAGMLPQESFFRTVQLGRATLAKLLRAPVGDVPADADAFFLFLLGRGEPPCSLAVPGQLRDFRMHQARKGIYAAAVGLTVVSLAWGGFNMLSRETDVKRAAATRQEAVRLRILYDEAARRFPEAAQPVDDMRKAVQAVEQLQGAARTPEKLMATISHGLMEFPNIALLRLDWRYRGAGTETERGRSQTGPEQWQEQGEMEAEIRPFEGDYRAMLALIERFAQSLRRQPGVAEVRVVRMPVNLDSTTTLSGNTQDAPETKPGAAQFRISVSMARSL